MRFDFCIGNPPYQEELKDTSDRPVYNYFMDAAYSIASKVEFITPARFLFNAGKTPKEWNEKLLSDVHFKVLNYEPNSNRIFSNVSIAGGVAVTYRDKTKFFGSIGIFTNNVILDNIFHKVVDGSSFNNSLSEIICLQNKWNLDKLFDDYPHLSSKLGSNGRERRLTTNIFTVANEVFFANKHDDSDILIHGIVNSNHRTFKYISKEYLLDNGVLSSFKVLVCKSNPTGFGEILAKPFVAKPNEGFTQSFLSFGSFDNEYYAYNLVKYLSTKLCRCLLSLLKVTQDNPPSFWKYVPVQDFTDKSDIDWSKSVHEIDLQLYKKYGLSEEEIQFIEEKVKPMA